MQSHPTSPAGKPSDKPDSEGSEASSLSWIFQLLHMFSQVDALGLGRGKEERLCSLDPSTELTGKTNIGIRDKSLLVFGNSNLRVLLTRLKQHQASMGSMGQATVLQSE